MQVQLATFGYLRFLFYNRAAGSNAVEENCFSLDLPVELWGVPSLLGRVYHDLAYI